MRAALLSGAAALVALCGCGDHTGAVGAQPPAAPAKQVVAIVDVSKSIDRGRRTEGEALLRSLTSDLTPGDRLVVVETYRANDPTAEQWAIQIPGYRDPRHPTVGEKRKATLTRQAALQVIPTFFDSAATHRASTTDIVSALFRAADQAKARPDAETLVLVLSDMLNATPELNMERSGGIPDSSWIESRKAEGRLPALSGLCVFVVGGDVKSARGVRARKFWIDYLRASGARTGSAQYREMVATPEELHC